MFFVSKFISNHLIKSQGHTFSKFAHNIGIVTISIGISSMLICTLFLGGLQKSISAKIFDVSGHIHIQSRYVCENSSNIVFKKHHVDSIKIKSKFTAIQDIYPYLYSNVLINAKKDVLGITLKGLNISNNKKYSHLKKYISKGRFFSNIPSINEANRETGVYDAKSPNFKNSFKGEHNIDTHSLIISEKIANEYKINVGDKLLAFFFVDVPKYRKLKVIGFYKTDIPDIDSQIALCNISLLQNVDKMNKNAVSGYEIILKSFSYLATTYPKLRRYFYRKPFLKVLNIKHQFHSLFDWLTILAKNKSILFILILIVIGANMISIVLVQLIDRSYMTGVLMSLGATNQTLRNIFIFNALNILIKGLLYGNIVGLGICLIQHYTKIIKLDPSGMYLEFVIIDWDLNKILYINIVSILSIICTVYLFTYIILKTRPINAMKFI